MREVTVFMTGRQAELNEAIRHLEAGHTVDIIGGRSSGRTTLLAAIRTELIERGWNVISVRGISSLRDHPYAALHLGGIGSPSGARDRSTIQSTVAALSERITERFTVLAIDDGDDLDESSWGAIEAVRRETGTPLLRIRSLGTAAQHTPSGLTSATLDASFLIELAPFDLDTLEEIITEYLNGPIEISTVSRIFEKSGGNIGLALSIIDAAIGEGLLVQSPDGFWTAEGGLWSRSLRGIVETQLRGLSPKARRALEIVARVGVAELTSVRRLIGWGALQDLEDRGMLRLVSTRGGQFVNITPPLVVQYFRHDQHSLRHARLAEFVAERLGDDSSELHFFQENVIAAPAGEQRQDAILRTLLMDRRRTREIVNRTEWSHTPTPATAVRYASALISSGAPADIVEQVLNSTDLLLGDAQSLAEFTILQTRFHLGENNDVDAAREILRERAPRVGLYDRLLDIEELALTYQFVGLPDSWEERVTLVGGETVSVAVAVTEARLTILVALGRFEQAIQELEDVPREQLTPQMVLVGAIASGGLGQLEEATSQLRRAYEDASEDLDIDGIRFYGAGLAHMLYFQGNLSEVEAVLRRVFSIGSVPNIPMLTNRSVRSAAIRTAMSRDDVTVVEHQSKTDRSGQDDLLFGSSDLLLSNAWRMRKAGDLDGAAQLIWENADALWHRGARLAGAASMSNSLQMLYDAERLAIAQSRAELIDGPIFAETLRYIAAVHREDPDELVAVAEAISEHGRYGLALEIFRIAAVMYSERRDMTGTDAANEKERTLRERIGPAFIDSRQSLMASADLSDREREVVRLAADGMTNQQIARDLVLSIRTVESHMYHSLRKLGLTSRQSLRYYRERL